MVLLILLPDGFVIWGDDVVAVRKVYKGNEKLMHLHFFFLSPYTVSCSVFSN